ncbi:hypothetical protein DL771_009007 [Monosporascus sp. 5C6A]|nr:hypothetical protein DL771_009007 [Monosporascus sp. 5C6A]
MEHKTSLPTWDSRAPQGQTSLDLEFTQLQEAVDTEMKSTRGLTSFPPHTLSLQEPAVSGASLAATSSLSLHLERTPGQGSSGSLPKNLVGIWMRQEASSVNEDVENNDSTVPGHTNGSDTKAAHRRVKQRENRRRKRALKRQEKAEAMKDAERVDDTLEVEASKVQADGTDVQNDAAQRRKRHKPDPIERTRRFLLDLEEKNLSLFLQPGCARVTGPTEFRLVNAFLWHNADLGWRRFESVEQMQQLFDIKVAELSVLKRHEKNSRECLARSKHVLFAEDLSEGHQILQYLFTAAEKQQQILSGRLEQALQIQ